MLHGMHIDENETVGAATLAAKHTIFSWCCLHVMRPVCDLGRQCHLSRIGGTHRTV